MAAVEVQTEETHSVADNHIQNSVYIAPKTASEFEQYLLCEGDIVMTTVGSWFSAPLSAVGRNFIINKLFDNSLLNQNAVRLRTWKVINSRFLFANLGAQSFKNHLYNEAQGTANQAIITQDSIKKFLLCIPPENENGRIITKLDELLNICNSLLKAIKIAKQSQSIFSETLV